MEVHLFSGDTKPEEGELWQGSQYSWGQSCHLGGPKLEEWMDWQQPYEIQEVEIQTPAPGKKETLEQDRPGTDWLRSSSAEKDLGIVMGCELNMTQLHAWQQARPTTSWVVWKGACPVGWLAQ